MEIDHVERENIKNKIHFQNYVSKSVKTCLIYKCVSKLILLHNFRKERYSPGALPMFIIVLATVFYLVRLRFEEYMYIYKGLLVYKNKCQILRIKSKNT